MRCPKSASPSSKASFAVKDRANGLVPSVGWWANDLFGRWIVKK